VAGFTSREKGNGRACNMSGNTSTRAIDLSQHTLEDFISHTW
jgi:hypothetical protein